VHVDLERYSRRYVIDLVEKHGESLYCNRALNHFRHVLRWCVHFVRTKVAEVGDSGAIDVIVQQEPTIISRAFSLVLVSIYNSNDSGK